MSHCAPQCIPRCTAVHLGINAPTVGRRWPTASSIKCRHVRYSARTDLTKSGPNASGPARRAYIRSDIWPENLIAGVVQLVERRLVRVPRPFARFMTSTAGISAYPNVRTSPSSEGSIVLVKMRLSSGGCWMMYASGAKDPSSDSIPSHTTIFKFSNFACSRFSDESLLNLFRYLK